MRWFATSGKRSGCCRTTAASPGRSSSRLRLASAGLRQFSRSSTGTRSWLAFPQHGRFDARGFVAALADVGYRSIVVEPLGQSFAWFVAVRQSRLGGAAEVG